MESAIRKAQFSDPYIPAKLEFNVRFFADDASLFSLVHDSNDSSTRLGRDLGRVAGWAHQWKMSCNPDPSKQAVEVHFSRKINPVDTSPVYFNKLTEASCETLHIQGLAFDFHVEEIVLRANKGLGLITRLCRYLPRNFWWLFPRPLLDLTWITEMWYMTI